MKGIDHGKANFLGVVTILKRQSRSLRTNTFLREIFGLFRKAFILRETGSISLLPKVALELGMQTRNTEIALWAW